MPPDITSKQKTVASQCGAFSLLSQAFLRLVYLAALPPIWHAYAGRQYGDLAQPNTEIWQGPGRAMTAPSVFSSWKTSESSSTFSLALALI